ncbi:hypothetical protein [Pseudomonas sp. ICMP 460]|uniref:hypothetical protein n=1 Tax=Pseudomonas sp. ICMP 460 TaxID=1718917 RepID=UPI00117B4963|nr:hypothetical protein [Pseudomonas sp. ICMP 460]
MDTDSFTYQVIHNALYNLSLNPVITVNIPGFSVSNCVATILPTEASTGDYANNALPYMSVAPGVVTVRSKNPGETGNFGSLIKFRLLVMRFKN